MKLFETADRYCKESNWKTLALLKFCLFAMGMLIGMKVPEKHKRAAGRGKLLKFLPLTLLQTKAIMSTSGRGKRFLPPHISVSRENF